MIVDASSYALVNAIESLLEDAGAANVERKDGEIKPELMESVLEIATKPCQNVGEAGEQLRSLRHNVRQTAAGRGLTIGSAGTHPFAMWEDQRIVARPRYRDLISALRFVARQELIFGMHVHVGIDDADKAIHVANGMRVHVPVLLALSANSPFWRGDRTGLLSTRTPIFRQFPRVGMPPAYGDWEDWERQVAFMVSSGVMEDYTYLWYDVRPHPNLGTVEIRVCDSQTRAGAHGRAHGAHPGDGARARRALRRGHAARRVPVADARREQVARRAARPRGRDRRPAVQRARHDEGAHEAPARAPDAARPAARRRRTRWTASATCSSAATAPRARSSSTRPTRTSTRSWPRSSPPPRCDGAANVRGMPRGRSLESTGMSSPDLFVVCKNCQAEVSPYITECPYCGTRLRKRAPKIDRPDAPAKPPQREGRIGVRGPRRDAGGAPGSAEGAGEGQARGPRRSASAGCAAARSPASAATSTARPYATMVLVALSFGLWLSLAFYVARRLRDRRLRRRPVALLHRLAAQRGHRGAVRGRRRPRPVRLADRAPPRPDRRRRAVPALRPGRRSRRPPPSIPTRSSSARTAPASGCSAPGSCRCCSPAAAARTTTPTCSACSSSRPCCCSCRCCRRAARSPGCSAARSARSPASALAAAPARRADDAASATAPRRSTPPSRRCRTPSASATRRRSSRTPRPACRRVLGNALAAGRLVRPGARRAARQRRRHRGSGRARRGDPDARRGGDAAGDARRRVGRLRARAGARRAAQRQRTKGTSA